MTRPMTGTAQQVHLNRVAHVAGEAFAFVDSEPAPAAQRRPMVGGILWLMIGAAAAAALWVGF